MAAEPRSTTEEEVVARLEPDLGRLRDLLGPVASGKGPLP